MWGQGVFPVGEGQHYVCQDKGKAFCQEEKVGVIRDPRETHKWQLYWNDFFFSSETNELLLCLSVSDTLRCLTNLIIPFLPPALPLELCFCKEYQGAHLKFSTSSAPLLRGSLWDSVPANESQAEF